MPLTTAEICAMIAADFKKRRITHKVAADKIGTTKQTISNQISGKKRFSKNMAQKFSSAFGYSPAWLLYGDGEMFLAGHGYIGKDGENNLPYFVGNFEPILKESQTIRMAERIIEILNNKIAIEAFRAFIKGDYEQYHELIEILESDYAYNLPQTIWNNPDLTKRLRQTRQFFTDAETAAAKDLVLIEQKAANGEIIDVDAELDRFKEQLLKIKESQTESDASSNQKQ